MVEQHYVELQHNLLSWGRKPVLAAIYRDFHEKIAAELSVQSGAINVELGSGIGNIKEVIPDCLRTNLSLNPWIDRVENAYALTFADRSVANLILFDVFHHLRYPGTALKECRRVLVPGGRLILFEPCLSLLGYCVYGALHREPLGLRSVIQWIAPPGWSASAAEYYSAQGNATRIFLQGEKAREMRPWNAVKVARFSAISYVASGGYSGPQLYPDGALGLMRRIDAWCDALPAAFATRLLVVLEKPLAA